MRPSGRPQGHPSAGSAPRERDHGGGDRPAPCRTRQLSPPSPAVLRCSPREEGSSRSRGALRALSEGGRKAPFFAFLGAACPFFRLWMLPPRAFLRSRGVAPLHAFLGPFGALPAFRGHAIPASALGRLEPYGAFPAFGASKTSPCVLGPFGVLARCGGACRLCVPVFPSL